VTLIFAQVFIGLALPSQLSFSIALAELIPNKWRGYNNALLFFMAVPFSTFGPIIARNFVANTSQGWRWSYYVNLILTGLAIILAVVFYHPPVFEQLHTRTSKRKVLKELDYLGMLLFVAGLVLFLIGLSWGGQLYPWKSARSLSTLLVGLALIVGFFVWGKFFQDGMAIGRLIRCSDRGVRRQRSFVTTTVPQEPAVWWPSYGCRRCVRCFLPVECVLAATDFDPVGNRSHSNRLAVVHIGWRYVGWTSLRWCIDQSRESEVAACRSDDNNDRVYWRYVTLSLCSCSLLTAPQAWLPPIGTPWIPPKLYASWVASLWVT
jgi:hypothetical protein